MEYLRIGVIVNTFGLKGEVKIKSFSDFDDERYKKNNEVLVFYNNQYISLKVNTYRVNKGMNIVSFIDHNDINLVEKYKGDYCRVGRRSGKRKREPATDGRIHGGRHHHLPWQL